MAGYSSTLRGLTVTFPQMPTAAASRRMAPVVDALASYPLTLESTTDASRHPVLVATWQRSVTTARVRAATAAARHAARDALVTPTTHTVVGVTWTLTLPEQPSPEFAAQLHARLRRVVNGTYTVVTRRQALTVTWCGPGFTHQDLREVTAALAVGAHVPAASVHVHPSW